MVTSRLFVLQVVARLALLVLLAWTPYAALLLQFLVRDPARTTVMEAALPPIFAKGLIAVMPLVYKTLPNMQTRRLDEAGKRE